MDPTAITNIVSTLGFPIAACIALFFACKYMLQMQEKNTNRMFEMYEKSNAENREAIKANTDALNKLCEVLRDER